MYTKPQVTIDLDEYNELKSKVDSPQLTEEELSGSINCIIEFLKNPGSNVLNQFKYTTGIEIEISLDRRIGATPQFKITKNGNRKG